MPGARSTAWTWCPTRVTETEDRYAEFAATPPVGLARDAKPAAARFLVTDTGPKLPLGRKVALYGRRSGGKTFAAQLMAAEFVVNGAGVAWLNLDGMRPAELAERWELCGLSADSMAECITLYDRLPPHFGEFGPDGNSLVVIDSAAPLAYAMGVADSGSGVAKIEAELLTPVVSAGCTLVVIGHTAKNGDESSFLGSERWESAMDYVLHVKTVKAFSPGVGGSSALTLTKSRSGRPEQGPLCHMVVVPGSPPRFADLPPSAAASASGPEARLALAAEYDRDHPDESQTEAAEALAEKYPELGGARSWRNTLGEVRKNARQ